MDALGFRSFAKTLNGKSFVTLSRSFEFEVKVFPSGLQYSLFSNRASSFDGWKRIDRIVSRFAKTKSLRPGDYDDITANPIYALTLISHYIQTNTYLFFISKFQKLISGSAVKSKVRAIAGQLKVRGFVAGARLTTRGR